MSNKMRYMLASFFSGGLAAGFIFWYIHFFFLFSGVVGIAIFGRFFLLFQMLFTCCVVAILMLFLGLFFPVLIISRRLEIGFFSSITIFSVFSVIFLPIMAPVDFWRDPVYFMVGFVSGWAFWLTQEYLKYISNFNEEKKYNFIAHVFLLFSVFIMLSVFMVLSFHGAAKNDEGKYKLNFSLKINDSDGDHVYEKLKKIGDELDGFQGVSVRDDSVFESLEESGKVIHITIDGKASSVVIYGDSTVRRWQRIPYQVFFYGDSSSAQYRSVSQNVIEMLGRSNLRMELYDSAGCVDVNAVAWDALVKNTSNISKYSQCTAE